PVDGADPPGDEPPGLAGGQAQQLVVGGLIAALGARHERAGVKLLVWGHEKRLPVIYVGPASAVTRPNPTMVAGSAIWSGESSGESPDESPDDSPDESAETAMMRAPPLLFWKEPSCARSPSPSWPCS